MRVFFIGFGQAGGKIVDMFIEQDKKLGTNSFRGIAVNTARTDLMGLKNIEMKDRILIGQTMVTYEVTDWRDGLIWWIQSVYVDAPWRRLGVFRALYAKVVDAARASGTARMIRLYVEKDNRKAHATYQALGMAPSAYTIYEADVNG